MASYSNILAYEIPLTEEPGMLQVHEVARVGHNLTATPQLPPSFPIPFFKFPHFAYEIQVRRDEGHLFLKNNDSSRRCYRSSQNQSTSLFGISGWGIDLDCCDV